MTLLANGWYDFATRRPGPVAKQYQETNKRLGWTGHSMEGWFATNDTLDDPNRGSWHGTILITGEPKQHYSSLACPFASGSKPANTQYCAWELEGLAGTPMNAAQLATVQRMYGDWIAAGLPKLVRGVNLFDHHEIATRWSPNEGPTACPSGRWEPFYAWLVESPTDPEGDNEAMTEDQIREIVRSELEAQVVAAGPSNLTEFVSFVSERFFAIHRATGRGSANEILGEIHLATDPDASLADLERIN